ncbi:MAG: hypothetical protein IT532_15420 [Burkholderiales bacterium]|nr:hypothetical protein [Burkholderiales bacterium]
MRIARHLLSILAVLSALAPGRSALAVDAALISRLANDDVAGKVEAIGILVASGDPAALPLLRALQDGNLARTPTGQIIIAEPEAAAKDAVTMLTLDPAPEAVQSVGINNRVRGALASALSAFRLFSHERDERLQAARQLANSAPASIGPILSKVLQTESDPQIRELLAQVGNVGPDLGQSYIIDSFMVVVLGGVGQLAGTVYAALGLGVAMKFMEPYIGAVPTKILILVLIIAFIQKRPQGLFALKGRAVEA